MNNIIHFHAGSKSFIIFRRHFYDNGILSFTKIKDVLEGKLDDKIIYDGNNNVYIDCHNDILENIAKMTYENDIQYFTKPIEKPFGVLSGGEKETEFIDSDVLKNITLSDSPNIDTTSDILSDKQIYNTNIDDLVSDIENDISNKKNSTSELETDIEYNGSIKTKYVKLN